jgi:hypothetical protein
LHRPLVAKFRKETKDVSTEKWSRTTHESGAAKCFASREALVEALKAKGWAVFLSCLGEQVMGIPKGSPAPDYCPFCTFPGLSHPGLCAIFAYSPNWGDGPEEERGYVLQYQGLPLELDGITVKVDEMPTPQQAEEVIREERRELDARSRG